jgi:cyanate permease
MVTISPETAANIAHRHRHWVSWLAFVLFNVTLLSLFLAVVWLFDIDSHTFLSRLQSMTQFFHLQDTWQVVAFFGASGGTLLTIYGWLWQKVYWACLTPYLFKYIANGNKKP